MSIDLENISLEHDEPPRILIIDDNPRIHRDFELVLCEEPDNSELVVDERRVYGLPISASEQKCAYVLDHATSGHEGIEKVKLGMAHGRQYQVAFVDIRMPGIDGVETIAQIWSLDPRIQAVICTAYADYSQEDLIRKLGRTDKLLLLKKPFDSIEVTQMAMTLAAKWLLARQAALKMEQMELLISQRTRAILDLQRRERPSSSEPETSRLTGSASEANPGSKKKPLILLVEKEAQASRNIAQILGNDFNIVEARTDSSGLETAREQIPDLIIVDGFPGNIDGRDLCRTLKSGQLTNHIPIIVLAGSPDGGDQLGYLEAGADDYMSQPLSAAILKARVADLLASRRKFRAGFHQGITLQPRELAANQTDARFLSRTIAVIEQNMSNFEFDVDILSQKTAVSRRQLFRKIKAVINTTPKALIRAVRLKRAAQLLLESEMTITEITFATGFQDVKYFRSLFKGQFGVLPSEYLKEPCKPS